MLPSGEQFTLSDGRQEAVICEVGATLRRYVVDGHDVCWGFGEHERSTGGRGQVLAPWPNRLEDGTFERDGVVANAALDEPELRNAIHGLVRWIGWQVEQLGSTSLHARCIINAQPGYPFSVALTCQYELLPDGLVVRTTAENVGERPAPFGLGFHSYLHAGAGKLDGSLVQLPARRHVLLDERKLPRSSAPVGEGVLAELCSSAAAPLGERRLDDCVTDLRLDPDGRWRVRFVPSGDPGDAVTLWADGRFGWIMVFTGDTLGAGERRRALAVEPMTCPPNALRSGEGLAVLAPGEHLTVAWGLAPDRLA